MLTDLDLLLHPVRMRIVHALAGGVTLTTSELRARLPDLAQATIYRHVRLLAENDLIRAVSERRVRGATERSYQLNAEAAHIDESDARRMTLEDHRHAFAVAVGVLMAEFNRYLDGVGSSPSDDLVGYRQFPVWMSPVEFRDLIAEVSAAIRSVATNGPSNERRPYLLSPIAFPLPEPAPDEG